jgi:hypothetical protein
MKLIGNNFVLPALQSNDKLALILIKVDQILMLTTLSPKSKLTAKISSPPIIKNVNNILMLLLHYI